MGHLTSRFGNVSPQGKVIGWESSSIAVSLEESSPMAGAKKIYFRCTGTKRTLRFRQFRTSNERTTWQRYKKESLGGFVKRLKTCYKHVHLGIWPA